MGTGEDFPPTLFLACGHDLCPSCLLPGLGILYPWMAGEDSSCLGTGWQFALLHYAWAENTGIKHEEQEITAVFLI